MTIKDGYKLNSGRTFQKVMPAMGMLLLLVLSGTAALGLESSKNFKAGREITDRAGRKVTIPVIPERIACLHGPSYEKVFVLGAADRIALVTNRMPPWNYVLNPRLKDIPVLTDYVEIDVEQLLHLNVDLTLYHPFPKQIERMTKSGIPVVVPYDGSKRKTTLEEFLADCYQQMGFYGEILGGDAKAIAEAHNAYADERIRKVLTVTSKIPKAGRPTVYYVCGQIGGASNTQSLNSTAYFMVEAAGGKMLTVEDNSTFAKISTEQILAWDPDFIVISTSSSTDMIVKDPRFSQLKAVRENRVFLNPEGLFYWTHFSSEYFLNILFLAKLLHPDLFPDLNVTQELKDYYSKFYHYTLSDDEANRIMHHLPPETKVDKKIIEEI